MAVDKSLNQAPLGLDASLAAGIEPGVNMPEPDMEIEFEDDESDMLDEEGSGWGLRGGRQQPQGLDTDLRRRT